MFYFKSCLLSSDYGILCKISKAFQVTSANEVPENSVKDDFTGSYFVLAHNYM